MARTHGAGAWPRALSVLLALGWPAAAEQLPLRTYRGAAGLPPGQIRALLEDRMGYLWVGTGDGLARFDGRRFVSYGLLEGLPHPAVSTIAEDTQGRLWVGTYGGGIALLSDQPSSQPFRHFATDPPEVLALGAAGDGAIYWTSTAGLHRGRLTESGWRTERLLEAPLLLDADRKPSFCARAERDARGRVWLGLADRVVIVGDGGASAYGPPPRAAGTPALGVVPNGETGALVIYPSAVYELKLGPGGESWTTWLELPAAVPFLGSWTRGGGDSLFLGARVGLVRRGRGGARFFTASHGLPGGVVYALATSREGSVWIGTQDSLNRLGRDADASVTAADGLDMFVRALVECPDGRLYASGAHGIFEITESRAVPLPDSRRPPFESTGERLVCDRRGDFWIGTDEGLYRAPGPRLELRAATRVGQAEGIPATAVSRDGMHEDAQGGLWVATMDGAIHQRAPGAAVFRRLPDRPSRGARPMPARALALDRGGGLWVSDYGGALSRFAGGRWREIDAGAGLVSTDVRSLLSDGRGRLWLGTRFHGAAVCDDPTAEPPRFVSHSTRNGLQSDAVRSFAADRFGRVYLATARGVARLDPATGSWRHFTMRDGLPGDHVLELRVDGRGGLWAATVGGLTRLELSAPGSTPAPMAYLLRVRTPEGDAPLPPRGAASLAPLTLPPSSGLFVEFAAPQLDAEGTRFQYRLVGGADESWSEPQAETSVNFARLAPGAYGFSVRALDADGRPGATPAAFRFSVQAPFWRRPLPQALAFGVLAALAFAAHRWRVSRVLVLERLRRQIATDLHDDVGSGLTEIALLSEVVRRDAGAASHARLATVASLARSLRESMSDIVWAVDPRRDRLADLVDRMRQVAFNMAEADGIRVDFEVPGADELARIDLTPDRKRHLLLAFKEAMTNVARHSGGSRARVALKLAGRRLVLSVADDGRGFDPAASAAGVGLASLRRRAAEIGGSLDLDSAKGSGTTLRLEVPVER